MNNDLITLIDEVVKTDDIGQQISTETTRDVFCRIKSISRAEWFDAGRNNMKPSFSAIVDFDDYQDEKIAEYGGKRYGIYRTYSAEQKEIELYCEEKAGV